MPRLQLRLLGGFELRVPDRTGNVLSAKKACALLAYLALHPAAPLSRERLAALLWGHVSARAARVSLRQCLVTLRRTIPHDDLPCLLRGSDALNLDPTRIEIDVAHFERCCDRRTPAALETALALYRGELLEGLHIDEAAFEEWLEGERRRLRERRLHASLRLLSHYETAGRHERAICTGIELLTLDPLQEAVHRSLMRCFDAMGRRRSVLRQFHRCRAALRRELGIEPGLETRRLYERLFERPSAPDIGAENERSASV